LRKYRLLILSKIWDTILSLITFRFSKGIFTFKLAFGVAYFLIFLLQISIVTMIAYLTVKTFFFPRERLDKKEVATVLKSPQFRGLGIKGVANKKEFL
jgi:hypothetical protein